MSRCVVCVLVALSAACSGSSSSPVAPTPVTSSPPSAAAPPPTPTGPPTVIITAAGLNPLEITIAVGQRVTFTNNDTRPHDFLGGIDPEHPDCPEIGVAGFVTPGQSRDPAVFTTPHTCEYHDHSALGVPSFQGRIVIK